MTGDERLAKVAEVLGKHGIYGFNGSQVACRCSQREWRYLLDWHDHVAQALAPLLDEFRAEDEARALRDRDHWKAHAEEAGRGFARVCRDYARANARAAEVRARMEALAGEWDAIARESRPHLGCLDMHRHLAAELRAALAAVEPDAGERPVDLTRLNYGICPKCGEDKFIGHGPWCIDCFTGGGA